MTEPRMTGTVERRAPVVTELSELNRRTTRRWERCRHRYSDERMILRYCGGPDVWMHVCLGCGVPVLLDASSKRQKAKDSATRGSLHSAQGRKSVAA